MELRATQKQADSHTVGQLPKACSRTGDCLCALAGPHVPALITTYSTVCHHLYQCSSMLLHLRVLCGCTLLPCLSHSGSSTGSVCGLDGRGAQGGSALTVGGNSFRKYQTARHPHSYTQTYNPQSFFLLKEQLKLLFRLRGIDTQQNRRRSSVCSRVFSGVTVCMLNLWR